MGGGAGARVVHGSIAAAAVVLATAFAKMDMPDKLHLKAVPILFYAMPVSMPLPPLPSLSDSFGCGDGASCSVSLPRMLPPKVCATPPSTGSLYASSSFSFAQGASGVSCLSTSSRRALSHFYPVYHATPIVPHVSALNSSLYPSTSCITPPALAPFSFLSSGLYSAPVTQKHISGGFQGWNQCGNSAYSHTLSYHSLNQKHSAQTHTLTYLESLFSTLVSIQPSLQNNFSTHPSRSLHTWHAPDAQNSNLDNCNAAQDALVKKPVLTVVLLGWLGAQQKHLKKYAEWYNARGIHAVTFVIPMADILSFKVEKNAEEHVDFLARHLAQWLSDQGEHGDADGEKQLMFHTFSNTGWLTYGIILEKMQDQGHLLGKIKGCVIDSAPVPDPDPQVWASGFLAALLKKRSSATKPGSLKGQVKEGVTVESVSVNTGATFETEGTNSFETVVLSLLEGFFSLFLRLPTINQ